VCKQNIIEINNFSKNYKKTTAVKNLSLKIKKGSFFGFIGPNGAGKTTTVNFIAGLLKRDAGELKVDGEIITDSSYKYKGKIGFILEKPLYIEKLTGREYLYFTGQMQNVDLKTVKQRTDELLDFLELTEKKDKLIETYSIGMKRKISIAAALIHNPKILILDEPFEGIDPISVKKIKENLKLMVKKGKTIFLTSHVLEIVESLCTDIAIINKGEIVYNGTINDLYERFKLSGSQDEKLNLEEIFMKLVAQDEQKSQLSWIKDKV